MFAAPIVVSLASLVSVAFCTCLLQSDATSNKSYLVKRGFSEYYCVFKLWTMAPLPLEGMQGPTTYIPTGQEGPRCGSISLSMLIDFIIQRTYHDLTVLAEL